VRQVDPLMGLGTAAALRRVAAWRSDAAVVFGSGLESLPAGATVDDELSYGELGWPSTAVPGHGNRLRLIRVPTAGGAGLRLALACGRPHGYEGWSRVELERPVRDLVSAGAGRVLLTNSCGALRPEVAPGAIVACAEVVALQAPPVVAVPPRMPVCTAEEAAAVAASLAPAPARVRASAPTWPSPGRSSRRPPRWSGWPATVTLSACPRRRKCALRASPAPVVACWRWWSIGQPR